jgi:hypothetical protein
MSRLFFGVAFMISCRTAHHEATRRNAHELHVRDLCYVEILRIRFGFGPGIALRREFTPNRLRASRFRSETGAKIDRCCVILFSPAISKGQRDVSLSNEEKLIGLGLTRFTLDNAVPLVSS